MKKLILLILILFSITLLTSCTEDSPRKRAMIGNPNASIIIDEFSDFECPACATVGPELEAVVLRNKDIVQLNFYHFPLSYHQHAFLAAEAAECANDQSKFWEFAKTAFTNQNNLTEDNLKTFASNLGLDTAKFDTCLDSGEKKSFVKADTYEGRSRQLSFTPSIYVNKQLVKWTTAEEFEKYIKSL